MIIFFFIIIFLQKGKRDYTYVYVSGVLHRSPSSSGCLSNLNSIDVIYKTKYENICVTLNILSYHMWCQGINTFQHSYKKNVNIKNNKCEAETFTRFIFLRMRSYKWNIEEIKFLFKLLKNQLLSVYEL